MGRGRWTGAVGVVLWACSSSTTAGLGTAQKGGTGSAGGATSETDARSPAGSGGARGVCTAGDTRVCLTPGACQGTQACRADGSGYGACDCRVTVGAGGVGAGGASAGGAAASGGGGLFGGGGINTGVDAGAVGCTGTVVSTKSPVDLYVMFDQSSSMGTALMGSSDTWWSAAATAVESFVTSPAALGIGMGIQYFPLGGAVAPQSCSADYATPEVEIGLLPGAANAQASAIVTSIQNHAPTTFTPTGPALQGAINHMKAWGPAHPGREPVVVLVTDGFPTECNPQLITDIAALAKTGFGTPPSVRTFVVGLEDGGGLGNLDEIAAAGGTNKAFLISGGDLSAQFATIVQNVASEPPTCSIPLPVPLPQTPPLDVQQVNVRLTAPSAQPTLVPKVNSLSDCALNAGGAWYFDDAARPAQVVLCPVTCGQLGSSSLEIVLGCASIPGRVN